MATNILQNTLHLSDYSWATRSCPSTEIVLNVPRREREENLLPGEVNGRVVTFIPQLDYIVLLGAEYHENGGGAWMVVTSEMKVDDHLLTVFDRFTAGFSSLRPAISSSFVLPFPESPLEPRYLLIDDSTQSVIELEAVKEAGNWMIIPFKAFRMPHRKGAKYRLARISFLQVAESSVQAAVGAGVPQWRAAEVQPS